MVGGSFAIYRGVAELCTLRYRDSEALYVGLTDTAYCSLRSQLLMALHDVGHQELCTQVSYTIITYLAVFILLTISNFSIISLRNLRFLR